MFYNFTLRIFKSKNTINEIGQSLNTYSYDRSIKCDIQPSTKHIISKTFGEDIDSIYTVFADDDLEVGTIVKYKNDVFRINAKVDWIDYKIYSIENCEVVINEY